MLPSAQFTFDMCAGAYGCLKTQKITKGRLFHARVTVHHEINSKLGELSGLTPGALFYARIWRGTMCARLTREVKLISG